MSDNDETYKLDTTHRATDRRNSRVIEWVSVKDKKIPPKNTKLLFKIFNEDLALGHFNECFITENWKLLGKKITHWADISQLKPSEDL
ncbi:MAG TPA: hypothetical protein VK553_10475 [Candidatus Nitrosopolaris rasttigaisensis]|nr:hypothetical protein [Candidatus Nitrosopolaris rasttigaisensis]